VKLKNTYFILLASCGQRKNQNEVKSQQIIHTHWPLTTP
jgi:hypothetical protein